MSRRSLILALFAGIGVGTILLAAGAWWFLGAGSLRVQVSSPDAPNLRFSVPLAFVQAGVMAIPDRVFAEVRDEIGDEIGNWEPGFERICDALVDAPDGVFVQVESDGEHITVSKKRGTFHIRVEDGEESVRVQVPIKAIRMLGRKLADDL